MTTASSQPAHLGIWEFSKASTTRVGDPDVAVLSRAVVDDVERDALEGEEERQRHHEGRDPHLRPQEPDQQADDDAGEQSGADADRPRHVVADHQPHHDRGADTAGEARGEVDLAEQQDEDQAHRQQDGAGALGQHVAEVVETPERRLDRREQDHQDDQAGDRRQRAHLAAAHPLPVEAEVVAGRAGRRRCRGDRREILVERRLASASAAVGCLRRSRPACRAPSSRPVVMSSTSCCWLTSERFTCAAIWPRYSTAMLSATSSTSFMLCEISTTARPRSARRRTRLRTCAVCATPRAAVGSSSMTTLEFQSTALAMATVWRWPPDRLATRCRTDFTVRTDRDCRVSSAELLHAALVEHDAAAALPAEEHVLDDVEVVAQREVLVDDLDAERAGVAGRVDGDGLALEEVVAGVDGVGAARCT